MIWWWQAWPIYAGFTVHCLMIIRKYLSVSHKPNYQRSGLNTYQFFVSMIEIGFRFDTAKKIKSLGNSYDRVDQKTRRNDDNTLGVPTANLELKHMPILCLWCVHSMFVTCSYCVRDVFILCSWCVHIMFVMCSYYVRDVLIVCSWHVHIMFVMCSYYVRDVFILC